MNLLVSASNALFALTFYNAVSNTELEDFVDIESKSLTCFPMKVINMDDYGNITQVRELNCEPSELLNDSYRWEM